MVTVNEQRLVVAIEHNRQNVMHGVERNALLLSPLHVKHMVVNTVLC